MIDKFKLKKIIVIGTCAGLIKVLKNIDKRDDNWCSLPPGGSVIQKYNFFHTHSPHTFTQKYIFREFFGNQKEY